ncbi:hypothetical protein D3C87_1592000 [compost metagenome]
MASTTTMKGKVARTLAGVAPPSEPRDQKVMSRSARSSATKIIRPVSAPLIAATAMPARISVVVEVAPSLVAMT